MMRKLALAAGLGAAVGQDLFLAARNEANLQEPSDLDLRRASQTVPGALYVASEPGHIATRLNMHLTNLAKKQVKSCDSFTLSELLETLTSLWAHRSPQLADHYGIEDGRSYPHSDVSDFEVAWKSLGSADASLGAACADVAKLFVHHLTESARKAVLKNPKLSLPLLAAYNSSHAAKGKVYAESLTCVVGHNMTQRTYDHNWPHWPEEAHYYGYGHGAYPFWQGGGSGSGDPDLEVWYSQTRFAEKLYHNACATSELTGYSKDVPCYHMMLGSEPNPVAYLWTKDEDYCCKAETSSSETNKSLRFPPSGGGGGMTAPQADFMDTMTYQGTGTFSGHFYTGDVKKYTLELADSEPVTWFFYYTTPDGHPVCQGEGGNAPDSQKGRGIFVWHEYNVTSFQATTHSDSTFAVPDVCKQTTYTCGFPN
jgi:hypothetical protein